MAATFEKAESENSLPFARNGCPFVWGAYFCVGAYKRDVVVVIKMGTYIYGVLILCGCLLSRFYGVCRFPIPCSNFNTKFQMLHDHQLWSNTKPMNGIRQMNLLIQW